ncbi:MAG: ABC transporter ATP-binding protein [Burkholderiales bacterium]
MLNLQNVSKRYAGNTPILNDLSFQLNTGDYIAIMGESGSGKSTLLNLVAGLDTPDSGHVTLDGEDLAALSDEARTTLRASNIGFIFQAFHLLPHLSLLHNVALPLALLGRPYSQRDAQARTLLASLGLAGREASLPRELSGGEMQRAAIARALIHAPKLVLADEPTGNLDSRSAETVLALLKQQIKGRGAAGILITHSLAAAQTADRILMLNAGKLESRSP